MIDIKALEKGGLDAYKKDFFNRGGNPDQLDQLLTLNSERKKAITEFETKRAEQNKITQDIAQLKREKKDATAALESMKNLSAAVKELEAKVAEIDARVTHEAAHFPNRCHESVPIGKSADDNTVIRTVGTPTLLSFKPKDHTELGENLGILNFERAGKIAGARFAILTGAAARLERALIQFMLDTHTKEHGYIETLPPFIVNSASLFGTGTLPKFRQDVFHLEDTDYFLIPTAEVPVTNYFRDEILEAEQLPVCYAAYTPCFRSEAGNYGKDTKGLIRQHQFDKVELVKFTRPETSYEEHEKLVANAETILKKLELPYRTMCLSTGDISFAAAKCYDLEVWLPSQNAYREISSCSNFEDFQARRANIRFKEKGGKPQFVHTINGSGLAVGRTLIAILENYQQEDGTIKIPEALVPYFDGKTFIK
ncbi:MAG: serine--tRNA ligase [Bdellovibrionales bacterium]